MGTCRDLVRCRAHTSAVCLQTVADAAEIVAAEITPRIIFISREKVLSACVHGVSLSFDVGEI